MSCCCLFNENSPCTIDEAVKNTLVTGGVTATIRTGGMAHQESSTYPIMILEVLNPTNPRLSCECVQWDSVLSMRVFSVSKEQGINLANQAAPLVKNKCIDSKAGNFRVVRSSPPAQLELSDELFLTRVNMALVVFVPK